MSPLVQFSHIKIYDADSIVAVSGNRGFVHNIIQASSLQYGLVLEEKTVFVPVACLAYCCHRDVARVFLILSRLF